MKARMGISSRGLRALSWPFVIGFVVVWNALNLLAMWLSIGFERDFLQKIGALEPLEDRLWQVSHEIEGMLRDVGSLEERN